MARVLFFGRLADLAGESQTTIKVPLRLSQILSDLGSDNLPLGIALLEETTRAAHNQQIIPVGDDPFIGIEDELAFMPPVSGG